MEESSSDSMQPARRRTSSRLSLIKATEFVLGAVAKISEPRKEIDPEEEPDFAERHPLWEDDLPPILPRDDLAYDLLASERAPPQMSIVKEALEPVSLAQEEVRISESVALVRRRWKLAYAAVKKQLAIRNQAMRSSIGTGAELEGYALGVWDRYSPRRISLFQFLYNKKTEYAIFCLINAHVLVIILKASKRGTWEVATISLRQLDIIDLALTIIFSVECLARIACLGLYKGPKTYLKATYNKVDLLSVVDSWAHLISAHFFHRASFFRFLVFRLFRALLTLRDFEFFSNVLAIFEALKRSMEPLEDVMLLSVILLFFYALIGLQFFGSDMAYRCVRRSDGQISYPPIYCSHFTDRGFVCPINFKCKKVGGNPGYGSQSFDRIYYSLLTLFQVVSLEGWSFVMYVMGDVEFHIAVAYFITLVVIVTYFLVNIVVAAISGVFLRVRHEHQALLKSSRKNKQFSFYNATVLASILKDVIQEDNRKMTCKERFRQKTEQMRVKFSKAMSKTGSKVKRTFSTVSSFGAVSRLDTLADMDDWDPEGRTALSRSMSRSMTRSLSRSMSMGAQTARQTMSKKCRLIVKSCLFRYSELFAITANLLVLCLYHEGMPLKLLYIIYALEAFFIIFFTAEMVLRFLAVGLIEFMDDQMNTWDVFVIAVSAGAIMTRAYPNISGARIMRWFYIDKKETRTHSSIVADCIKGLGALSAVSFFYLLIIFVFAVIGMELYAGQYYDFYDGYPRDNFDNIFSSMLLWFTVTTADNWVNQMWNAMRSGVSNNWVGAFLFVSYFIITVFLILNLIIAVILEKTELSDNQKKRIQKAEYMKQLRSRQKRLLSSKRSGTWLVGAVEGATAGVKSLSKRLYTRKVKTISIRDQSSTSSSSLASSSAAAANMRRKPVHPAEAAPLAPPPIPGQLHQQIAQTSTQLYNSNDPNRQNVLTASSSSSASSFSSAGISIPRRMSSRASQILLGTGFSATLPGDRTPGTALRKSILALVNQNSDISALQIPASSQAPSATTKFAQFEPDLEPKKTLLKPEARPSFELSEYEELNRTFKMRSEQPWYLSDTSLFLFPPDSPIRLCCQKITDSRLFKYFVLVLIIISIALAIMMSQDASIPTKLDELNIWVFAMFAFEFLLKIIAFGFLLTPDPYLGDVYNFLDLFLLILDGLFLKKWNSSHQEQVIRTLIALRPFRLICRIEGIKVLTTNLLRTIPAVMSVLAFTLAIFSVFGVVGVQMFRGRFASCNSPVDSNIYCVGTDFSQAMILSPRVWSNPGFHFDNFPSALLSLFIVSTFDSIQTQFMYPMMDSHGPKGTQPARNKSPLNSLYLVAFICVGGFFILRMFVGVFIDQFGLISGSKLLTERQKLLRDTNRIVQKLKPLHKPKVPKWWLRRLCHKVVTHRKYAPVMRFIVLLDYSWLSSHFAGQPATLTVYRNGIEASFATLFLIDIIIKFLGFEFYDFISNPWNVFELCNAIVSETCMMPDTLSLRKTVGRIPMGARIFRVIRFTPRLNTLMRTVLVSMAHMMDIMGLLAILLIVFAIMGTQIFSTLRDGICIGPDMNFRNFGNSFVTLFQVMTQDNWSCLLLDARAQYPFCSMNDPIHGSNCGNSAVATLFFVIFVTVATHIFMNMFVASIIDTITFGLLKEKTIITPANLTHYQVLWSDQDFDPQSKGFIGMHKLRSFVDRLGVPLGRRHNAPSKWYARIEWEVFSFHVAGKGVPFRELLETLSLYKIGPQGLELAVRIEREKQIQSIYRYGASIKVQAAIRGFLVRRRNAKLKTSETHHVEPSIPKLTTMLFE